MQINKDNIQVFIHKKLTNQISDEELSKLNDAISSDVQLKNVEDQVNAVWEASASVPDSITFDKTAAYDFFLNNVAKESGHSVVAKSSESNTFRKVLPFLLLLAIAAATYAWFANTESQRTQLLDGSSFSSNDAVIDESTFSETNRHIAMASGQAFFEVKKDKDHPFTIHDSEFDLTVLGTSFIFDADENRVKVTEGKVALVSGEQKVEITTGQQASLVNGRFEVSNADFSQEHWISKGADFSDIPLTRAISLIEAKYRIKVKYDSDENLDLCSFTMTNTDDLSKEEVLALINRMYLGQLKRSGNSTYDLGFISCQ